jgi:hypothetical protein
VLNGTFCLCKLHAAIFSLNDSAFFRMVFHLLKLMSISRVLFVASNINSFNSCQIYLQVFHMSSKNIDADQRITHDLEKLTTDLSGLVTGMVKPLVDSLW